MSKPLELKLARGFSLPLEMVTEATAIVATRGAGKSSASAVVTEEAFGLGVQVVIFDRTGVYWGLRSDASGDGPGLGMYVLGGPHGDVPLEAHAGVLIADLVVDSGHSFVLDLSDFSKSAAIRFAADFLERLYDRKARARTTLLLVMDEAHFYAPQTPRGGFKGDAARLMGAMEDVVGLGRSRGLGALLTTQRTQALNKAILDLIETLFVMRMLSPRARDAVQGWIREKHEDDREGVIDTLDSLPTGTAWVWAPLRGVLQKVALRRIRTFDSYYAPRPGETVVEPSTRRELDLDALGEKMRATVERAKADDPAELRKQIRELRAELDKKSHSPEPVEVEVQVEVPIPTVPDDLMDRIKEIAAAAPSLADVARRVAELDEVAKLTVAQGVERTARLATPSREPTNLRPRPSAPSRQRPPAQAPSRQADDEFVPAAQNGSAKSGDARQKILDSLAWLEMVGISPATRLQVAMLSSYHPRTPSFSSAMRELNEEGWVSFPGAGKVQLLEPGRAAASPPAVPQSDEVLQEMIFRQVGDFRARMLREVLSDDPEPLARAELAERMGYHPRTPSFSSGLASLKNLGLITLPRAGYVAAAPTLFLGH